MVSYGDSNAVVEGDDNPQVGPQTLKVGGGPKDHRRLAALPAALLPQLAPHQDAGKITQSTSKALSHWYLIVYFVQASRARGKSFCSLLRSVLVL